MNFLKERVANLKHNIYYVLFLSVIQIWWCFTFPLFIRLNAPWNIIVSSITSCIGIGSIVVVSSQASLFVPFLRKDYVTKTPLFCQHLLKAWYILSAHLALLFLWYIDAYGMKDIEYAVFYLYSVASCVLLYHIAIKSNEISTSL